MNNKQSTPRWGRGGERHAPSLVCRPPLTRNGARWEGDASGLRIRLGLALGVTVAWDRWWESNLNDVDCSRVITAPAQACACIRDGINFAMVSRVPNASHSPSNWIQRVENEILISFFHIFVKTSYAPLSVLWSILNCFSSILYCLHCIVYTAETAHIFRKKVQPLVKHSIRNNFIWRLYVVEPHSWLLGQDIRKTWCSGFLFLVPVWNSCTRDTETLNSDSPINNYRNSQK